MSVQVRKEDVRKEKDGWVIRITPEAGDMKINQYRDVPVHEHLISLGFIEFIQRAKPGHLFCEVGKDGTTAGPADGVYRRILTMVRGAFDNKQVQPNHAWRYTFKTYGHEAGLKDLRSDASVKLMRATQFGFSCNYRSHVRNKVLGSSLSRRRG